MEDVRGHPETAHAGGAGLRAAAATCVYAFERLVRWDEALVLQLNRAACLAWVRAPFDVVSRLGDGVFWYGLMLALLLKFGESAWPVVLHMIGAGLTCTVLYKLVKAATLRPRPYEARPEVIMFTAPLDRFSFPSGHTLHAVAFSLVAHAYYPALSWLTVPFTALVAVSRITLGLHYPSDVLAGGLMGAAVAVVSFLFAG
jgi:undecaprenyl-diphosphatase